MENISVKVFKKDDGYFPMPISLENYYEQIKNYKSEGYSQVILTADVLLEVLKQAFVSHDAKIMNIELLDDQDVYQEELNALIDKVSENRDMFIVLFDDLADLNHSDSIELREIKLLIRKDEVANIVSVANNGYIHGEGNLSIIDSLNAAISSALGRKQC
ncbi:hypothetical protein SOP56_02655 [Weissella confusa]|uniref:hypothetical protein n=1 Tax=Weissella confusa TaxID=1583 RepID=UPI002A74DD16|nr:hypothetical protein [Weissella confusa]MDY2528758.1 hypothetical protein [Weissella confusa]